MADQAAEDSGAAVLWQPSAERMARSRLTAFAAHANTRHQAPIDSYQALWGWSVEKLEDFWAAAWEHFDVLASAPYQRVLTDRKMPGASWFPGARLNLAENVLRAERTGVALVAVSEQGPAREVSWAQLRGMVGAFQSTLDDLGVCAGDRVVAYVPNGVEAVAAMLACAAQGAIWSTCAPDIGPASAVDRFGQLAPKVLIAADGYRFGGKERDRADAVAKLLDGLPSVTGVVSVPVLGRGVTRDGVRVVSWADAVREPRSPVFAQLDAKAPLWVALGHNRFAEGAGARARRRAADGPGPAGPAVRHWSGRPVVLVHLNQLDHVEQSGRGAVDRRHRSLVRRQPAVAVARPAVAAGW